MAKRPSHGEAQSSFVKYSIEPRRGRSFSLRKNGARDRIATIAETDARDAIGVASFLDSEDS
jgi:hypothetical protein